MEDRLLAGLLVIQVNLGERHYLSQIHESCSPSDFGLNFRQEVPHLEITSSYYCQNCLSLG